MTRVTLEDLLRTIEARKAALGLEDTAEATEALRNPGTRRTPEKRELLRRAEARARAAGVRPVPARG